MKKMTSLLPAYQPEYTGHKWLSTAFCTLFTALCALSLAGCNDDEFLEENPKTIYTIETSFTKSSQVDASIVQDYYAFTELYGVSNMWMEWTQGRYSANLLHGDGADFLGGNGYPTSASGFTSNFQSLNSNTTIFNYLWNSLYSIAAVANLSMYGADLVEWEDDADKTYAVAQSRFFRGYAYLRLAECFGGVPIVPEYTEELRYDYTRSSRAETYQFAIDDLASAAADLPDYPKEDGRVAKGIAYHFLAEAYLGLGIETDDSDQYTSAIEAAQATIDLHPLMTERFGVRADPSDTGTTNDVANYRADGNVFYDLFQLGNYNYSCGNTESLMAVQQPTADEYDVSGGKFYCFGITCYTPFRDLNWASDYDEDGTSGGPWKANVDTDLYPGGSNSCYLGGTTWGLVGSCDYIDEVVWQDEMADDMRNEQINLCDPVVLDTLHSLYGQVCLKEWLEYPSAHMRISCKNTMQDGWGWTSRHAYSGGSYVLQWGRDWYVARSSETYLLLAEAYMRAGNQTKATEAINTVRQRAQAGYLYTSVTLQNILDERARELAWEEHRWPTLLRMNAGGTPCDEVSYQLTNHTMYASDCEQPGVTPEWGLFPIPLTVINLNVDAEMEQNYGW